MSEKKYPIAEIFTSPQGEGLYAGVLMTFIRFAGCSVGKKLSEHERAEWLQKDPDFGKNGGIPIYTEKCTIYDGREFLCDTDFRTKEVLTVEQIMAQVAPEVSHVCLTGGEPLDQPLTPLLDALAAKGLKIHFETSGTVDIAERAYPKIGEGIGIQAWLWITVSPKKNALPKMIGLADEIKLLVDDDFDIEKVPQQIKEHELVWLSPINNEFSLDRRNVDKCVALQRKYGKFRLALQAHKIWGVR